MEDLFLLESWVQFFTLNLMFVYTGNQENFSDLNMQRLVDQYFMNPFPGLDGCFLVLKTRI